MLVYIISFLIEFIKYRLSFYTFFSVKLKRKGLLIFGSFLFFALILIWKLKYIEAYVIMYIFIIALLILCVDEILFQRVIHVLILFFIISALDELSGIMVGYLNIHFFGGILTFEIEYILGSISTLILLICITFIYNKYMFYNNIKQIISKSINVVIAFMEISISLTITVLLYLRSYINNERLVLFNTIICAIAFISIILLGLFMIYIKNSNERMEKLIETEKKFIKIQQKYYEALLEKEEDTRNYRHDLSNHLIRLYELTEEGEVDTIKNYIEEMQGKIIFIQSKTYETGIKILDTFINYYSQSLNEDIKIYVAGKCTKEIDMSEIDLCTVFSNLIQNAIEALEQYIGDIKYLKIEVKQGMEYLQVQIINTTVDKSIYNDGKRFLHTKKKDPKNHGIGLRNVENTLVKNGGTLDIKIKNGEFIANVILKSKYKI